MSSTEMERRSPEQQLVARIREQDFRDQVAMALPPSVTTDRFVRVATTAVLTNPDIAKLDHNSLLKAMVQCAAAGLMPDGKQAAFVPRDGKAVFTPMIAGYRAIAAEHGWQLRTAVVYAEDEFDHAVIDGEERILHRPVRPGANRGNLIAAYAIAKHRDGRKQMTVLHPDDIARRRASASTDKVWSKHPAAMWEKSAGRDLFDQLGFSESDSEAARIAALVEEFNAGHGDAARALYGDTDRPALPPSAETPPVVNQPSTTGPTSTTEHTGENPQTDDAAKGSQTPSAAASPVPGEQADDEPDIGGSGVITAEGAPSDADIQLAGQNASLYKIPNGKYRDLALGELMQQGDDAHGWLQNRLKVVTDPPEYVSALWNFARVFAPELYQEALAKKEAEVTS